MFGFTLNKHEYELNLDNNQILASLTCTVKDGFGFQVKLRLGFGDDITSPIGIIIVKVS